MINDKFERFSTGGARGCAERDYQRSIPKRCTKPRCFKFTREGKPYCVDHVMLNDYVKGIAAVLERREAEVVKAETEGATGVDPKGLLSQEIMDELVNYGERTKRRLARDLRVSVDVISRCTDAMLGARMIHINPTRRGDEFVGLAG